MQNTTWSHIYHTFDSRGKFSVFAYEHTDKHYKGTKGIAQIEEICLQRCTVRCRVLWVSEENFAHPGNSLTLDIEPDHLVNVFRNMAEVFLYVVAECETPGHTALPVRGKKSEKQDSTILMGVSENNQYRGVKTIY